MSKKETERQESDELYKVPNLVKGLAVLELLSESHLGKSLQEIKMEVDLSLTTAYRIVTTLVRLDYLTYDDSSKKYKLSRKMLTIGFRSIHEHNLMDAVLPKMRELRDEIQESVFFGILSSEHILLLEQSIGSHTFCFYLNPGKLIELHCSAPGKAMMAYTPADIRTKILSKIEFTVYNDNTIADLDSYLSELERVRTMGYALDMEEEMTGVICISAPILDYSGMPCGCLWTSGPKDRLKPKMIEKIGKRLHQITKEISEGFGCTLFT